MARADAIRRAHPFVALALVFPIDSCENTNRTVTVECGPPPGATIAATQEDSFEGPPTFGLFTSHPLPPGSLLELTSPIGESSTARVISTYTVNTSTADFFPLQNDAVFWALVDATFELKSPPDASQAGVEKSGPLIARVVRNTTAVVSGSRRLMLRDPLAIVNADKSAQERVRMGNNRRAFVLVTGLVYADRIDLVGLNYSQHPEVAVNTIELGNEHVHYNFSCASVDGINEKAQSSGTSVPIAFIYRSVKYSQDGLVVWDDGSPPDLARYSGL